MSTERNESFYWRSFVTFYVVISFLVIATSGIVLSIAPPGRVANWSRWSLGAVDKSGWQAVHTIFAFLFVVAAAFHIYFNWRVILAYIRSRMGGLTVRRGRELAAASAIVAAVLTLTLGRVAPFSTLMALGEDAKNSWTTPSSEPPAPHAEEWTVAKFAESMRIPVETALANLATSGMPTASAEVTLAAIAARHNLTPQQVYIRALGTATPARMPLSEGGGIGRKTVRQVCEQLGLPVETGLDRLRRGGMADASPDSTMRELGQQHGRAPFDVARVIEGPR